MRLDRLGLTLAGGRPRAGRGSLSRAGPAALRGTGDLGLVVERAAGRVQLIETTGRTSLGAIEGLGDLSHASMVFCRDGRFAYVFGRDGGLTKVDLLERKIAKRVIQAGNAIGGAISQDGALVAVSNYEPGGVRVFDATTLEPVADIPATMGPKRPLQGRRSGRRARPPLRLQPVRCRRDLGRRPERPGRARDPQFTGVGAQPYDGLITPDGRHYLAGLFGEDGLALLDLWDPDKGVQRILDGYGRGEEPLPVYKMPHLEGWASAGDVLVLPAVGRHELLVVDRRTWQETGRIAVHGQPVFAVARPDGRQVWVNFAHPDNGVVQVIDVPTREIVRELRPGPGGAAPRVHAARRAGLDLGARCRPGRGLRHRAPSSVWPRSPADKPSGIFFTARAHRIGL